MTAAFVPTKLVVTVALLAHLPPLLATRLLHLHASTITVLHPLARSSPRVPAWVREQWSRTYVPAWVRLCRHGETVRETLERAHLFSVLQTQKLPDEICST